MSRPDLRNGGRDDFFYLFRKLNDAKNSKTKWIKAFFSYKFKFESDEESDDTLEIYNHDDLEFKTDDEDGYYSCKILKIDLNSSTFSDGSFYQSD